MANKKLGIDVEIKYPSASEIKKSLNKEWQKVKESYDVKVNVSPDKNSLKKMRKQIQDFLQTKDFDYKLHVDGTQAMKDINSVRRELKRLRDLAEDDININFTGLKQNKNNLKQMSDSIDTVKSKQAKADTSRSGMLRDIISLQKELTGVQKKSVRAGTEEQEVLNKRVGELSVQLNLAQREYKDLFGDNADDNWMIENVKRVGQFNIELNQAKETQKETNDLVKKYTKMLNDQFRIQKDIEKAGDREKAVLQEQLGVISEKSTKLYESNNLAERMTKEQEEAVKAVKQQNEYQLKLNKAKVEDKEITQAKKDSMKELKKDLKEIHGIRVKINDLEAKREAGVITAKEEDKLKILQLQLKTREEMYEESKKDAQYLGKEEEDILNTIKDQYTQKEKVSKEVSEVNAELKKTNNLYDELFSSVRRVVSLNKELAKAGRDEADVIRKAIKAEEDLQDSIRDKIKLQDRVNDSREEEYANIRKAVAQQEELNAERSVAGQRDTFRQNSAIGMFNPMTVYNEGRQVAMEVYDVVSELDTQVVNIEKVADASESEMNRFKDNVYGFATDVGKSADEYAGSVERWVTQGFTLAEGMEMARESTMGAFVGNIDEKDMVDYMSVPLVSYKDTALEVSDVLNAMNEVANNNAVEMRDLGEAYKKASNTASTAGTSFSELTGLIAGAQESTRFGGEMIGTSLRTIDMNFAKIASEITGTDERKSNFFKSIGVDLKDSQGELRSTYDIIEDLKDVWGKLNSTDKSTASFYASGKRHSAVLQGIIGSWEDVEKATREADGQLAIMDKETGSAYEEFGKQKESVEYAIAELKNAWAEFIYEISGGRDGVKMVVDQLVDLLEIAQKLAENDRLMSFAKTFLKATLWLTAASAMQKVFSFLDGGISLITGNLGALIPKVGKTAKTTAVATKSVSGLSGVFGIAKGALGKFIPIVGGVVTALTILDLLGVDVVGTFKKMIDGGFGASKQIEEYEKTIKDASKTIQNNSLINKEFDEVNKMLDEYKKLNREKEKLAEEKEMGVSYSKEEFSKIRQDFKAQSDALDLDLEIKFNDYDHIKAQLDELEAQKNRLEVNSADELITSIKERNKLPTNRESYDESLENTKDKYKYLMNQEGITEEMRKEYKDILDGLTRTSSDHLQDVFSQKDFQDAKKLREEAREEALKTRKDLVEIHDTLSPYDLGKTDSFWMGQELLPSIADMQNDISVYDDLAKAIEEGGELSEEYLSNLYAIAPEYTELESTVKDWSKEDTKAVKEIISAQKELKEETTQSVEERVRALLNYSKEVSGLTDEEIDKAVNGMRGTHQEVIKIMSSLGETGQLALGVTEEALVMYGDQWSSVMVRMQNQLDEINDDKEFEYKFSTEDGYFNWEIVEIVQAMPEKLTTKYDLIDNNGLPKLENLLEMFESIPKEKLSEVGITDSVGHLSLEEFSKLLEKLPPEEVVKIFVEDSDAVEKFESTMDWADDVEGRDPKVTFYGEKQPFNQVLSTVNQDIDNVEDPEVSFTGEKEDFDANKNNVLRDITGLNNNPATVNINGNRDNFDDMNSQLLEDAKGQTVWIRFKGWLDDSGISSWWKGKVKNARANRYRPAKSVGIGMTGQGTSNSVGMAQRGVSNSTTTDSDGEDTRPPAKVDSEVWRYWAKELYKGMPLNASMDKLNDAISHANDDNKELIRLYKEQNRLINSQIDYEKSMKKSQQSEMTYILSQLRKEGFRTSGNKITNLGISKKMSGERAERSSDLLNQWKTLYEALDATNARIRDLNSNKLSNNTSIKEANESLLEESIERELEAIEKSITRTEGILTAIENDVSLFSSKYGSISDADFELKLAVTEEGIRESSGNISALTKEFNRLSQAKVKHSENAGEVQTQLEGLRDEIMNNADSIIEYRNALKELELQRMASDFDKFATTIESNLGRVSNNIDNLQSGLLSGQSLSDLESASLVGLDFNRKTEVERHYQERLSLEKELNDALEGYAKRNIERSKHVANSTLSIEHKKYKELLGMAKEFSGGKISNVGEVSIGNNKKGREYESWQESLRSINNDYVEAYNEMVKKYDNAMSKADTKTEKEAINNAMIIEQLQLQEDIYQSMIKSNGDAIKNTQDMLKDSSLTTEQREALLANIEEYRQSSIDAQNSIRDSVQSRFDLEFGLLDEMTEKAEEYTSQLSHMMEIAEAIGGGSDVINDLNKAMFDSKINEYNSATEILNDLISRQSDFDEGSYEWNLLQDRIEDTQQSIKDLTIEVLNANKEILDSQLDIIQNSSEEASLGGMSADEFDRYKNEWMDGVEKELELEKLRMRLVELEDKTLQGRLELMDRQEKVSRSELEYLDKQIEATRLQEKLENIRQQRSVQTLTKNVDGNWEWGYVADQTEYNDTKEDLDNINLEIEKYRQEQRRSYVDDMNNIVDNVREGDYDDIADLREDISQTNSLYDDIFKDIEGMNLYDTDSIIQAYKDYLENNQGIVSGSNNGGMLGEDLVGSTGRFEESFANIATDLSGLIAEELKTVLNAEPVKNNNGFVIQNQTLEFPNVTDSDGLEDAFRSLPQVVKQFSTNKD